MEGSPVGGICEPIQLALREGTEPLTLTDMESHPGDTLGTRFLTFWGAVAAFFGFALFAILLEKCSSGVAQDPRDPVREGNLVEIRAEGISELEKLGWGTGDAEAVKAAVGVALGRKQQETEVVVPGTETAARLAAEAAAAAPAAEGEETGENQEGGTGDGGAQPEPEGDAPEAAPESTPGPVSEGTGSGAGPEGEEAKDTNEN